MEDKKKEITPFHMQVLMEVAAKIVKIMVTGVWHLSFEEMEMVLSFVHDGIEECRQKNGAERKGQECFLKQEK